MAELTIKDLKEAKYNPRVISEKRLDNLHLSMTTYGDLSGVVFNKKTQNLISGHQRLKRLRGKDVKTKIVTKPVKDAFGTVAEGHIVAKTASGEIRIPLRIVDWSDKKSEMAANIAANAHGGDFDRTKLGAMLEKLDAGKSFDVNVLGIDPLSLRGLMPKMPTLDSKGREIDNDGEGKESFQEFGEDSFEFEHCCPKCKFQFNTSAKSQPAAKAEPKAPKLKLKEKDGKKAKDKSKDKEKVKSKDKGDKPKKSKLAAPKKTELKMPAKKKK